MSGEVWSTFRQLAGSSYSGIRVQNEIFAEKSLPTILNLYFAAKDLAMNNTSEIDLTSPVSLDLGFVIAVFPQGKIKSLPSLLLIGLRYYLK